MTPNEALKNICNNCEKEKGKRKVACPFRSISNEYCEEYKIIENSLKALDIYKYLFPITLTEIQGQKCISIPADDIRRSDILVPINDEAYEILKEVL